MKLKHQYVFGLFSLVCTAFGGGMMFLLIVIGVPPISTISAISIIITGLGFTIMIKFLSTIKKIDVYVEDVDD